MLYKLTDENDQTFNETQWGPGVTHKALSGKGKLCSKYYIHAYTDPLLAVFLNPIHADFKSPHLWTAKGRVAATDNGLKVGCKSLTTVERIELPVMTTPQRVAAGILCVKLVCTDPNWNAWADNWLSGKDRSAAAAWAAAAESAAAAAAAARAAAANIDLISIVHEAMKY